MLRRKQKTVRVRRNIRPLHLVGGQQLRLVCDKDPCREDLQAGKQEEARRLAYRECY